MRRTRIGEVLIGRLPKGADLLTALTEVVQTHGVRLGKVEALGAVEGARVGFYDQEKRVYGFLEFPGELEILALVGNVSLKDGEPMVHAHITLGDTQGRAFGGHLAPGTVIFACECCITVLEGEALQRGYDAPTGLPLWTEG